MIRVVAFGSAHTTNAELGNSILVSSPSAGAAAVQNIAAKNVRRAPGLFIVTGVLQRLSEQDFAAYVRYELSPLLRCTPRGTLARSYYYCASFQRQYHCIARPSVLVSAFPFDTMGISYGVFGLS